MLVVISFSDEDDAVRIINGAEYGLGGVWTADRDRTEIARRIRA